MVWFPTCKSFQCISQIVFLHLSCWNGAEKLLELVAWFALLPGPAQQLAHPFLVALPTAVGGEFVERLSRVLIRCSDLESRVGHVLTDCQRVESADEIGGELEGASGLPVLEEQFKQSHIYFRSSGFGIDC